MKDLKKIGIIGAMNEEVIGLVSEIERNEVKEIAGLTFNCGILRGKEVVIVECGIAKVNAAMCTQILISEFNVDAVINTGVAGALHKDIDINDIVISTDAIQYDVDASIMGDPKGTIPRMKTSVFYAEEKLVEIASKSFDELKEDNNCFKGRIVTGDRFVADNNEKKYLREHFNGYCCEMEGGAIAHVAYCNNIPFVIIRAISDNADHSADIKYEEFVIRAAKTSKNMVLNMLKNMS